MEVCKAWVGERNQKTNTQVQSFTLQASMEVCEAWVGKNKETNTQVQSLYIAG